MSKRELVARYGSMINDDDAKIIGPELERLAKEGRCDPDAIVKEASRKKSPLNPYFEWDDSEAACRWRKQEARILSRSVEVIVDGKRVPLLINVRITMENPMDPESTFEVRTYNTPDQIRHDSEKVESVIEDAKRDFLRMGRKYQQYLEMFAEFRDEYGQLFKLIEDLEQPELIGV